MIVGDRGLSAAVGGSNRPFRKMLKAEDHAFIRAGHGIFTGIKVEDRKKKKTEPA